MALATVAGLLERRYGLDPERIGEWRIDKAVTKRRRELHLADDARYAEALERDPRELEELLEEVLVSETRFFRHSRSFDHLRTVIENLPPPRRMLSAPCATGEEPFSLALLCLDAGLPLSEFHIDAVDVSTRALRHARAGWFGERALDLVPERIREAFFTREDGGFRIAERVAAAVTFHRANLLERPLPVSGPYQLVFSRNLLIYLRPTARKTLLEVLRRLLAPTGRLYVGQSELLAFAGDEFAVEDRTALAMRPAGGGSR